MASNKDKMNKKNYDSQSIIEYLMDEKEVHKIIFCYKIIFS